MPQAAATNNAIGSMITQSVHFAQVAMPGYSSGGFVGAVAAQALIALLQKLLHR